MVPTVVNQIGPTYHAYVDDKFQKLHLEWSCRRSVRSDSKHEMTWTGFRDGWMIMMMGQISMIQTQNLKVKTLYFILSNFCNCHFAEQCKHDIDNANKCSCDNRDPPCSRRLHMVALADQFRDTIKTKLSMSVRA